MDVAALMHGDAGPDASVVETLARAAGAHYGILKTAWAISARRRST
jgi:hypothetical protein